MTNLTSTLKSVSEWISRETGHVAAELSLERQESLPGPLVAGDSGPDRDPAGDGEGEGEGPVRAGGGSRGETWGEKGERAGVPWSPWTLPEPDAPELTAASVPVGKSSMEPDKSWNTERRHCKHKVWRISHMTWHYDMILTSSATNTVWQSSGVWFRNQNQQTVETPRAQTAAGDRGNPTSRKSTCQDSTSR